jgi:Zn finger protein HypA/HybF involved in hydrogenase expression
VRTEETLEVRCWQCFTSQELSARSERFQCRICGSRLRIDWHNPFTIEAV